MPAFEPSAALEELAGIIGGTGRTTIIILERHGYRTRECVKDYESSRQVTLFTTKVDSLGKASEGAIASLTRLVEKNSKAADSSC